MRSMMSLQGGQFVLDILSAAIERAKGLPTALHLSLPAKTSEGESKSRAWQPAEQQSVPACAERPMQSSGCEAVKTKRTTPW